MQKTPKQDFPSLPFWRASGRAPRDFTARIRREAQEKISATANFCRELFGRELRTIILNNSTIQVSYSNTHPHAPRRSPFCIFGPPSPPPPGDPESPSNPQPPRRRGPTSPC